MPLSVSTWSLWATVLFLTSATTALRPPLRARQDDSNTTFDWTSITPTADLQYHPCYGTFQCARLQLPLDYTRAGPPGNPYNLTTSTTGNTTTNNTYNGPLAAIALITLPATVPPSSPLYGGPIFVNPGGPGQSGTDMALAGGTTLQAMLDIPGERHYDIVGFDPRGVALSTPSALCYGVDGAGEFGRAVDAVRKEGMPSWLTGQGLQVQFEADKGFAGLCGQTAVGDEEGSVFRFMDTASVARDMLEIVVRIQEMQGRTGNGTASERPRLQYLGLSYGSFVGNTFASMFPGWLGRMVVDGIVDAEDYVTGTGAKNIADAEQSVDVFYRTCFNAGAACPLRQHDDTGASDIRARVSALLRKLEQSPVSTIYNGRVYIVSSSLISTAIQTSLYQAIAAYEPLSYALAGALAGNYTLILFNSAVMGFDDSSLVCAQTPATSPPQAYTFGAEALAGILCGDSQALSRTRNISWAAAAVALLTRQSPTIGEAWLRVPLPCANWQFTPPYAYHGPFGSPAPSNLTTTTTTTNNSNNNNGKGTPLAPLLILSSRTDHATPLANAFALAKQHGGAAVVVQESTGHTALLSSPSACVTALLRAYFRSGAVPASGTVCQPDCVASIPYKACPGLLGGF